MIRGLLRVVWGLPWPNRLRRLAPKLILVPGLRLLFVPHFMVGVVGLIIDEEGRLLLLEHTYRRRYPWGLPTGFVEHGEHPLAALEREIGEETGFSVDLSPVPTVYVSRRPPIVTVLYRGRFLGGQFGRGPEISAARFFALEEIPPLSPQQLALLRDALGEDWPWS